MTDRCLLHGPSLSCLRTKWQLPSRFAPRSPAPAFVKRLMPSRPVCAQESMKKHSVNGYMFCQQPPVVAMQGQDVRVILMGIGGKTDMHTPIFTDSVLLSPGNVAYTRTLLPGSVRVVELTTGARPLLAPWVP